MKKIVIINDIVGGLVGEKSNFWTWLLDELPAEPIHFHTLKIPLMEAVKQKSPDIIINNSIWGMNFPGYFTITLLQDNYVKMQELMGANFSRQIELQKNCLRNSDIKVANTNFIADSYKDCGSFEVIPLGTDTDIFKPMTKKKMREKYGIPSDRMVFIYVGSHDQIKGWSEIQKEIEMGTGFWILVFKDHQEPPMENIKVFCNIDQETLAELYNASDFCVTKSIVESQGLVGIEAMMCNVPVIYTKTGIYWDWDPPMKNPRKESFKKGLDKKTCIQKWKKLIEGVKL